MALRQEVGLAPCHPEGNRTGRTDDLWPITKGLPMKDGQDGPDDDGVLDPHVLSSLTAANAAWPESSRQQMMAMVENIAKSNEHIQKIIGYGSPIPSKAGFVAEEMHAETFNLESILQGKTARALTDRYQEWGHHGLKGNEPTVDVAIVDKDHIVHRAQNQILRELQKDRKCPPRDERWSTPLQGCRFLHRPR